MRFTCFGGVKEKKNTVTMSNTVQLFHSGPKAKTDTNIHIYNIVIMFTLLYVNRHLQRKRTYWIWSVRTKAALFVLFCYRCNLGFKKCLWVPRCNVLRLYFLSKFYPSIALGSCEVQSWYLRRGEHQKGHRVRSEGQTLKKPSKITCG